ncbi:MAG: GNAT family N-acetyltransferase [Bacteroidales bacterium]|nr:GNAT family N-acetyltransferase [Bacteroidales bacterium]
MERIIDPVNVDLLKAELTPDRKLCDTNKSFNEIYVVDCNNAPHVLQEIGRLREIAFRESGGGTGKSVDLDDFDFLPDRLYKQLVIWDPDASAILGGYRYIIGTDVNLDEKGQPILASSHLFHFSEEFIRDYLPHTIELGRSFVAPDYQSSKAGAKAIFALDNLWDGLAAIMLQHSEMMYFFGKMTVYPDYDKAALDLLLHFLNKHFPDMDELVCPGQSYKISTDPRLLDMILTGHDFKQDYRRLKEALRCLGTGIPPLVNSYMNVSPKMKVFGASVNDEFFNAIEVGILIAFEEMYADKRDRHKDPYFKRLAEKMRGRGGLRQELAELADKLLHKNDHERLIRFNAFLNRKKKGGEDKSPC